jgi:hypothetical protein
MSNRILRRSLWATTVSCIGLLATTVAPAAAVPGSADGVVTGTVHLVPGLPTGNVCASQVFNFAPITIAGVVVALPNSTAGTFATGLLVGGSALYPLPLPPPVGCAGAQENLLAGAGTINAFGFNSVATTPLPANGQCAGGTYLRIGTVVLVDLTGCFARVPADPFRTTFISPTGDLRVAALFLPDVTRGSNGVTTPVVDALVAGTFAGVGV